MEKRLHTYSMQRRLGEAGRLERRLHTNEEVRRGRKVGEKITHIYVVCRRG